MKKIIKHPYAHIIAFEFVKEITCKDFDPIVIPEIESPIKAFIY